MYIPIIDRDLHAKKHLSRKVERFGDTQTERGATKKAKFTEEQIEFALKTGRGAGVGRGGLMEVKLRLILLVGLAKDSAAKIK